MRERRKGPVRIEPVGLFGLLGRLVINVENLKGNVYFIIIIFVFGFTIAFRSSRSSFQSFFGSAFQRDTSAPREAGIS